MKKAGIFMICMVLLVLPLLVQAVSFSEDLPEVVEIGLFPSQIIEKNISLGEVCLLDNATLDDLAVKLVIPDEADLVYDQDIQIIGHLDMDTCVGGPTWSLMASDDSVPGTYSAYIEYIWENSTQKSEDIELVILSYDLLTVGSSSIDGKDYQGDSLYIADQFPTISIETSKESECRGSLDSSQPYDNMSIIFSGDGLDHNYEFSSSLECGSHYLDVICIDENNLTGESYTMDFVVDITSPDISLISPLLKVSADYTEIVIEVDEMAECRISEDIVSFNDKETFDEDEECIFRKVIEDLEDGIDKDYYVECRDKAGNSAQLQVTVRTRLPPSAEIELSDPSPVKEGIIEVTLIPSVSLKAVPSLNYSFTDDPDFSRVVVLSEKGDNYVGNLIIDDYDNERIGRFIFEGIDLDGVSGTEITEGAGFVVDTIRPKKPESIIIGLDDDGTVRLGYHMDGAEGVTYNIYRSTGAGVDYMHLYHTTKREYYLDDDIVAGMRYYYKVAAVDEAGNIGPLSDEVDIVTGSVVSSIKISEKKAPTYQTIEKLNGSIKAANALMIDLDWAESGFKEKQDSVSAIDDLSLLKIVSDAKEELERIIKQLSEIGLSDYSDDELNALLDKSDEILLRLTKKTPSSLELESDSEMIQKAQSYDIERAIAGTIGQEQSIDSYLKNNIALQDEVRVEAKIKSLIIKYLDGTTQNLVLVDKKVILDSPDVLDNIKVVELIPASLGMDMSEIMVNTPDYEYKEEEPIFYWHLDEFDYDGFSYSYVLYLKDTAGLAKDSKSVVLLDYDSSEGQESAITGFASFVESVSPFGFFQSLGLFIGTALIIGLLGYYMVAIRGGFAIGQEISKKPENIVFNNNLLARPDQYFFLKNGDVIRSLDEFGEVLQNLDDHTFKHHVNDVKNDFSTWVKDVFGMDSLAYDISKIDSREKTVDVLKKHGVGRVK